MPTATLLKWMLRACAFLVALVALAVLVGYGAHRPGVIHLAPGLQGMSILTACGLLALAVGIVASSAHRPAAARALAGVALAIGVAVLLLQIALGSDPLSPAIARRLFGFDAAGAGQTSPGTAACLALMGGAGCWRDRPALTDACHFLVFTISGVALLGYAYGVQELYAVPVFRSMALHTALGLFLLALASLILHPGTGIAAIVLSPSVGGRATRRQLTFTILPPIFGVLLIEAIGAHRLGASAAIAFLVVLTVVPLILLILRDGQAMEQLELERQRRAELQAALTRDLRRELAAQAAQLELEMAERAKAEEALGRTQRMEAMGQLTGGIAHDFNNLLMAIGGSLQLLLKRLPSEHPGRRFAVNAQSAADKGAKLAGQLLAFSRTQRLDLRPVEIDAVLRDAGALIGTLGPHIAIETRLTMPQAWAMTDPEQLELAILNLALNARDAMPDGGHLIIESGQCRRTPSTDDTSKDYLVVRVRDTGVGMTTEVAARAVEPFFTTKERGRGSGLGLAQVYGFVRQCGGDLDIDSAPGQGTSIALLLPRVPAPAPAIAPAPIAAKAAESRGTQGTQPLLLVIDDDPAVRGVLVDSLRDGGFKVIEAASGAQGLNLLDLHAPDAAIIDFLMPGMNGAEVARYAQRRRPGLPIIFVSGYYDTLALDEIAGAVILRKPIDVGRLQSTVASVLQAVP